MKYTLISFAVSLDITAAIESSVFESQKHRAQIFHGAYVFNTQKGWPDIHRLRTYLAGQKIAFVELPFEQALAGFFDPATRDKLKAIGINDDALFNLSE
jgi:hypothetical protein